MAGKVVAITGASRGIGEATARRLAQSGYQVVVGARRTDRLKLLADDMAAAGAPVLYAALDVANRQSMYAFIDLAISHFGKIDALVNNAGIMARSHICEARQDEWDRMIDVNIKGVLNGVAAALPAMLKQGSGHIIFVGSTSGQRVVPGNGVYCVTKFAVRALAESVRLEGEGKVRSTLISPGATRSGMLEQAEGAPISPEMQRRIETMLSPDAVAAAIAYALEQPEEVGVNEITVRSLTFTV